MRHATLAAVIAAALTLGACSHSAPPGQPAANLASPATTPAPNPQQPQPELNTPDQAYVVMDNAMRVLALESALSTPKYELMAKATSSDYRATQDSFKQHDLLTTLQPKFDVAINEAKSHRYITWISPYPQIGHYDFNAKTFPVNSGLLQPSGATQFYVDHQPYAQIGVTNGAAFRALHVADEAKARAMETLVDRTSGLRLKIFAFAQGTDETGTPMVETQIVKVQVLDPHDQVLIEQNAGGAQ